MKPFIFSADSHVREPNSLFVDALPESLRRHAVRVVKEDDTMITRTEDKVIFRLRLAKNPDFGGTTRLGIYDLDGRLVDMDKDGIDAEIAFPSLGLWLYAIDDPEAELAQCEIYNNWNNDYFSGRLDRFVRCGVLPVRDLANTQRELKRIAAIGFTAAMLPSITAPGIPKYNDPAWDPVFHLAGELGIVLVLHTGTGAETVTGEKGPGAAVINYSSQMSDGVAAIMYMVSGGVLDRNPKAQVAVIECGASWLAAIAERMDEVYVAHDIFVRPKLSMMPSEIIKRQVTVSFQHDRACIMSRSVTGTRALMFASDYPHAEGTFPHTQDVIGKLFDGIDISEDDKLDILGRNAARLFRFDHALIAPTKVPVAA
ncbi:amidohydrolase family protein [Sphingomonas immobilis]|uniref:Amidohydrolase family protein n=1 Tax=Sphingomonas immobilis TaxID=3063997 RepID=A0ABT8ZXC4_9SPHN|nr:amidohydrolase family protein [Sphingomonas sp. CA1-15]MDO7842201.1 amidohydrolase family protein [Sphingomonas sp. CA1-15]